MLVQIDSELLLQYGPTKGCFWKIMANGNLPNDHTVIHFALRSKCLRSCFTCTYGGGECLGWFSGGQRSKIGRQGRVWRGVFTDQGTKFKGLGIACWHPLENIHCGRDSGLRVDWISSPVNDSVCPWLPQCCALCSQWSSHSGGESIHGSAIMGTLPRRLMRLLLLLKVQLMNCRDQRYVSNTLPIIEETDQPLGESWLPSEDPFYLEKVSDCPYWNWIIFQVCIFLFSMQHLSLHHPML